MVNAVLSRCALSQIERKKMFLVDLIAHAECRVCDPLKAKTPIETLRAEILLPDAEHHHVIVEQPRLSDGPVHKGLPYPASRHVSAQVELAKLDSFSFTKVKIKPIIESKAAIADHFAAALCNAEHLARVSDFGGDGRFGFGLGKEGGEVCIGVNMPKRIHKARPRQFGERGGVFGYWRAVKDHRIDCASHSRQSHLQASDRIAIMAVIARFTLAALGALALSSSPVQASTKGWEDASDIGVYSLFAASIAIPVLKNDGKGVLQAGGSFVAASLVTEGLKEAFPTLRPDGSDRRSFPSGHTSRSFAAAATIWKRNGAAYGIPAAIVAGLVGTARMKANKHRFGEVAVGAAIGLASGILITNKHAGAQTTLVPWGDTKGGGLAFAARF